MWSYLDDNLEVSTYSPEPGEASLPADSWDGAPSALLSLIPTAAVCYSPDNGMDACHASPSGMMCGCSTVIHGEGMSMSSQRDFHANPGVSQENKSEPVMTAISGLIPSGWFAKYDLATSTWRTSQGSLLTRTLDVFSGTWPQQGMIRDGAAWELQMSAPPTSESVSGYWATPTARDWRSGKASAATHAKNSRPLSEQVGGNLNPMWVEWLQNWPTGWTALEPLAMAGFLLRQSQHGTS